MNVMFESPSEADDEAPEADLPVLQAALDEAGDTVVTPDPLPVDPLRSLRLELREQAGRLAEAQSDLHAAEDQIHRLEAQLRVRNARLAQLQRQAGELSPALVANNDAPGTESLLATTPDMAALFAAADAASDAPSAGGWQDSPRGTGPLALPQAAPTPAVSNSRASVPEGAARFLVLMDGDSEVVHLLGRRTTLGRGPDNDIQIDQRFVSRHHAILAAGPNQTVIEDLRSTNGVLVNGQRVRRCVLNEGDVVLIGKTQFRFALRRN